MKTRSTCKFIDKMYKNNSLLNETKINIWVNSYFGDCKSRSMGQIAVWHNRLTLRCDQIEYINLITYLTLVKLIVSYCVVFNSLATHFCNVSHLNFCTFAKLISNLLIYYRRICWCAHKYGLLLKMFTCSRKSH